MTGGIEKRREARGRTGIVEHRRFTMMGVSLVKANVAPPLRLASVASPCSLLYRLLLRRDRFVGATRTRFHFGYREHLEEPLHYPPLVIRTFSDQEERVI